MTNMMLPRWAQKLGGQEKHSPPASRKRRKGLEFHLPQNCLQRKNPAPRQSCWSHQEAKNLSRRHKEAREDPPLPWLHGHYQIIKHTFHTSLFWDVPLHFRECIVFIECIMLREHSIYPLAFVCQRELKWQANVNVISKFQESFEFDRKSFKAIISF